MGWSDILMEHSSNCRCQLAAAMYALHISEGNSLFCIRIKHDTIRNYVNDFGSLVALATGRIILKDNPQDSQLAQVIQDVLDNVKQFEKEPTQREPFTVEMFRLATHSTVSQSSALADWEEASLMAGFQVSEYAQASE